HTGEPRSRIPFPQRAMSFARRCSRTRRPRRAPELGRRPTAGHAGRARRRTPAGPPPPRRAGPAREPPFPVAGGGGGGVVTAWWGGGRSGREGSGGGAGFAGCGGGRARYADRMLELTQLLEAAATGDRQAAADLLPLVYDELRRLAAHRLARESPGHTLQPTALVHEAYLRLPREPRAAGPRGAGPGPALPPPATAPRPPR